MENKYYSVRTKAPNFVVQFNQGSGNINEFYTADSIEEAKKQFLERYKNEKYIVMISQIES